MDPEERMSWIYLTRVCLEEDRQKSFIVSCFICRSVSRSSCLGGRFMDGASVSGHNCGKDLLSLDRLSEGFIFTQTHTYKLTFSTNDHCFVLSREPHVI